MNPSDNVSSPVLEAAMTTGDAGSVRVHDRRSRRLEALQRSSLSPREEALVPDERSKLRPAQVVEHKLTRILQDASLPVSHLQMRGLLRTR